MNFPYSLVPGLSAKIPQPFIPVRYHFNGSFTLPILTLLDSGADVSHFSTQLADFFGIDWKNLPEFTTTAANGEPFPRYVLSSAMKIEIGGNEIELSPVSFSPKLAGPFPFILGQDNFFTLCRVAFERYNWNIEISVQ